MMGTVTWVIKNIASQKLSDEDLTSSQEIRVGGHPERSLDLTTPYWSMRCTPKGYLCARRLRMSLVSRWVSVVSGILVSLS